MKNPISYLTETLRQVRDLIEDYVDVKDSGCGPMPNAAMLATQLIDDALRRVIGNTK